MDDLMEVIMMWVIALIVYAFPSAQILGMAAGGDWGLFIRWLPLGIGYWLLVIALLVPQCADILNGCWGGE
jgi:hypothetical protein